MLVVPEHTIATCYARTVSDLIAQARDEMIDEVTKIHEEEVLNKVGLPNDRAALHAEVEG